MDHIPELQRCSHLTVPGPTCRAFPRWVCHVCDAIACGVHVTRAGNVPVCTCGLTMSALKREAAR